MGFAEAIVASTAIISTAWVIVVFMKSDRFR